MSTRPASTDASRWSSEDLYGALRWGGVIGLWIGSLGVAAYVVAFYLHTGWIGADTHAYWIAARRAHPYQAAPGYVDAFEYSPIFHEVIRPLGLLPFRVCYALWLTIEASIYVWLTRGVPWRWRVPVLLFCAPELALGNLYGFFSLVLVMGLAAPELWCLPLLTKITPAGPGLLWFLLTGRFRQLARTLVCAAALVAVSAAVQPGLWGEWFAYLHTSSSGSMSDILVRCLIAAVITVIAARTGWLWLLPAGVIICTPVNGGVNKDLAMLPVTIWLYHHHRGLSIRSIRRPAPGDAPRGEA